MDFFDSLLVKTYITVEFPVTRDRKGIKSVCPAKLKRFFAMKFYRVELSELTSVSLICSRQF